MNFLANPIKAYNVGLAALDTSGGAYHIHCFAFAVLQKSYVLESFSYQYLEIFLFLLCSQKVSSPLCECSLIYLTCVLLMTI